MACSPSSLGICRKPRQAQGGPKDHLLSTSHEPSKDKVIVAPVCPSGKTAGDMTCHCSKEPAVQGIDGNSRGGCVPSPNQERERAHGGGFLENIKNPINGTENCFADTRWSVVDGRFWSNMACIDEYEKKEFGSLEEEKIKLELQLADIAADIHFDIDPLFEPIQTTTEHLEMYTNPPGCPLEQELICLPSEEGKICSYGSVSCCGEIKPRVAVECKNGFWSPSLVIPDERCLFGYDEEC